MSGEMSGAEYTGPLTATHHAEIPCWCGKSHPIELRHQPPAAPVVQGADGLPEAIARALFESDREQIGEADLSWDNYLLGDELMGLRTAYRAAADAVLALPEVARLLAERDELDRMLREAGIEYPTGLRAVSDLIDQRDGQRQRAEEAEAERDQAQAKVARVRELAQSWRSVDQPLALQLAGDDLYEALGGDT